MDRSNAFLAFAWTGAANLVTRMSDRPDIWIHQRLCRQVIEALRGAGSQVSPPSTIEIWKTARLSYRAEPDAAISFVPVAELLAFVDRHGYLVLVFVVFAEQVGLPLPALPILLAGGALARAGECHGAGQTRR